MKSISTCAFLLVAAITGIVLAEKTDPPKSRSSDESEILSSYIGNWRGRIYEVPVDRKAADKSGHRIGLQGYLSEPKGISILEAARLADEAAKQLLGEEYTADDPRWLMKNIERVCEGESDPYYYVAHFHTREGAYSDPKVLGPDGDMPIVILLDGTVVKPKPSSKNK